MRSCRLGPCTESAGCGHVTMAAILDPVLEVELPNNEVRRFTRRVCAVVRMELWNFSLDSMTVQTEEIWR